MQIIGPFKMNAAQGPQGPSRVSGGNTQPTTSAKPTRGADQLDISAEAQAASRTEQTSTVGGDMRLDKIADIRRQIADGTYDTDEKMEVAFNRMFDELA